MDDEEDAGERRSTQRTLERTTKATLGSRATRTKRMTLGKTTTRKNQRTTRRERQVL